MNRLEIDFDEANFLYRLFNDKVAFLCFLKIEHPN